MSLILLAELLAVSFLAGPASVFLVQQAAAARPVNVFVINDAENDVANKSVTNALKMLKEKSPNKLGKVYVATVNASGSTETLDSICPVWKSALQEKDENIPDFVLDTATYGLGAETVNRFTAFLGIPTLSAQYGQDGDMLGWRDITKEQQQYLVQVMNPVDLMPEVVRQQCSTFNISNAAILFDDTFVMDHKYKSLLLNVATRHVMVPAKAPGIALERQITMLRNLDIVNFFILGSDGLISAALQAVNKLDFVGNKYGMFAVSMNESPSITCPKCPTGKVMLFHPQPATNQQQLSELASKGVLAQPLITSAFYYDLARIGVLGMKAALDAGEWKRPTFVTCEDYNENATLPARNLNFRKYLQQASGTGFTPIYAGFAWGENGVSRAKFDVNADIIEITSSRIVESDTVETWPAGIESPLNVKKMNAAQKNTAITSYRVVTVIKPPFVMYDHQTRKWSGYCIDLLNHITKHVPFVYDIHEAKDKDYGAMDEEGVWTGMVRELKDKTADIALGAFAVMAERENVIDYTVPYYDLVGITILRRRPKTTTSLFKFLTVLEIDVWLCIFGAYLFTSLLMWFFDRFSPYSYQNNREKYKDDEDKRLFDLKESLWFCMTSLTPQGGGEAPKCLSGRLVAATWWLFGFIIVASYTANLAAFLTVSRLELPVESLEDLSRQYKIQYAPIANSTEYRYFERMAEIEMKFYEIWKDMSLNDSLSDFERAKLAVWDYPVSDKYTKMFQTMKDAGFPKDLDDALARVRSEGQTEFAFIGDATDIKYLTMVNCDLMQIGDEFSRKPYAIGVQQGSPLKDQFNNAILMMLNKRDLERLKDKWWDYSKYKKNCPRPEEQNEGISINNIGGVFIVIFVGVFLACVTLLIEYFYFRRPKMRRKKLQEQIEQQQQQQQTDAIADDKSAQVVGNVSKSMKLNFRPAPTPVVEPTDFGARF
ncbi:ionotropic receptor 25a-like [Copidosoma floridanum]|uniref:ionotropic receptor 25a-like n=1 Tax=Copidosoma floridanum TaxID=29053 RepID=UPI0006C954D1|nr:ionotropic receptor 25a-like [Copidosoma floridanum]